MNNFSMAIGATLLLSIPHSAFAERVFVPSDPNATYDIEVMDVGEGKSALLVVGKRVGPSGTSYTAREVNCFKSTFRYMGEGDTFNEMKANINDRARMGPLVQGSISYYIVQAACD